MSGPNPAAALAAALPGDGAEDIVRIRLVGESGVEGLDLGTLTAVAQPYFASVTLRDHTRLRRELWERLEENSLTGLFLRSMRRRMDEAEDGAEREKLELAARFGLAALEGREEVRP